MCIAQYPKPLISLGASSTGYNTVCAEALDNKEKSERAKDYNEIWIQGEVLTD